MFLDNYNHKLLELEMARFTSIDILEVILNRYYDCLASQLRSDLKG